MIHILKYFAADLVSNFISNYFTSEKNSLTEREQKAIIIAAEIIEKKRKGEEINTAEVNKTTSVIDETLNRKKVEHEAGKGTITAEEALERLIDRKVAHYGTFVEKAILTNTSKITGWIGEKVGGLFDKKKAAVGRVFGEKIGEIVKEPIAKAMKKGVGIIGTAAKKVGAKLMKVGKKLFSKLFS